MNATQTISSWNTSYFILSPQHISRWNYYLNLLLNLMKKKKKLMAKSKLGQLFAMDPPVKVFTVLQHPKEYMFHLPNIQFYWSIPSWKLICFKWCVTFPRLLLNAIYRCTISVRLNLMVLRKWWFDCLTGKMYWINFVKCLHCYQFDGWNRNECLLCLCYVLGANAIPIFVIVKKGILLVIQFNERVVYCRLMPYI